MRISIAQLRKYIKESISDAEAERRVGKYLWPKRGKRNIGVDEPDTKYEEELFKAFEDSIAMNEMPLTSQQAKDLFDLAETGKYSDILNFYEGGTLYTGVNVTHDWLKSTFGVTLRQVVTQPPDPKLYAHTYQKVYRIPDAAGYVHGDEGLITSWTTEPEVAEQFAAGMDFKGPKAAVGVMLVTKAPPGVFLDYRPTYQMSYMMERFRVENEIVSLHPVRITDAYVIYTPHRAANIDEYEKSDVAKDAEFIKGRPDRNMKPLRRAQQDEILPGSSRDGSRR